jgi:hypothetical protein
MICPTVSPDCVEKSKDFPFLNPTTLDDEESGCKTSVPPPPNKLAIHSILFGFWLIIFIYSAVSTLNIAVHLNSYVLWYRNSPHAIDMYVICSMVAKDHCYKWKDHHQCCNECGKGAPLGGGNINVAAKHDGRKELCERMWKDDSTNTEPCVTDFNFSRRLLTKHSCDGPLPLCHHSLGLASSIQENLFE